MLYLSPAEFFKRGMTAQAQGIMVPAHDPEVMTPEFLIRPAEVRAVLLTAWTQGHITQEIRQRAS